MRKVVLDKQELLETVKENREKHKEVYEKACDEYRKKVAKRFRELADVADEGGLPDPSTDLNKPEEHLDDYDQSIEMLEADQRDQVTLTNEEYQKLVEDDWNWSRRFARNTSSYV